MLCRNPTSRGLLYAAAAIVLLLLPACDDGRHPVSPSLAAEPLPLSTTMGDARGCAFSGVVRESPGNFLSVGAAVNLVKEPGGYSAPVLYSGTTDTTGRYRIDGVTCGLGLLARVTKADFSGAEVSVLFNDNVQRDFTIDRITYLLRGIVRESASATRLTDATVEVVSGPYAGQTDTTRHDGSYGLSVRDTVTVRASKPGYLSQEATVTVTTPGGAAYDFSLVGRR